jgi:hypothetical protein
MSGLSQDAKLLVAECRGQGGPSREDRARLSAKLAPAWAAYERERPLHTARGSRAWWSASAARWLLCVSLSWLAPQIEQAAAIQRAPVDAARLQPSATEPARVTKPAPPALPLPAASVEPRGLRVAPAREDARDVANHRPTPRDAREAARASSAPLAVRAVSARAASQTTSEAQARASDEGVTREAQAVPAGGTRPTPRAMTAPRVARAEDARAAERTAPQPRAAELASSEPERADHAPPEQGGPQFVLQPIGDELELLGVAQDALRRHQPSVALRLVQQHAFRFPRGALKRERQAVQILALCALQRFGPARTVFEDLNQNSSESPMLESVRRACGF